MWSKRDADKCPCPPRPVACSPAHLEQVLVSALCLHQQLMLLLQVPKRLRQAVFFRR